MRYMIHACPRREWFVQGYMIPEMTRQGIDPEDIEVWMDSNGDGNLFSCMKSFDACGKRDGGTWHLQDDIVFASNFAEMTRKFDYGITCGFGRREWQPLPAETGTVPAIHMWMSFQCIRIPDKLAGECAEWFFTDALYRDSYKNEVEQNKYDDSFWFDFIQEAHSEVRVTNIAPNIVDHVDFLLGGSVLHRREDTARSSWWEDDAALRRLENMIDKIAP